MRKHREIIKIVLSAVLLIIALLLPETEIPWRMILCIVAFIPVGLSVVIAAVSNLFRGSVFDENLLMSLATIGAFAIGEHHEAVAVMLFYQVGELFQSRAVQRSRASIKALMSIRPDKATVVRDEVPTEVSPRQVKIGETILVKVGERIPLDGTVLTGNSYLDTSALTGESVPRAVRPGDTVLSGCINTSGVLTLEVTKEFSQSAVNRILALVQDAAGNKSRPENFITAFAKWYTPLVVIVALLLSFLPPLILGQSITPWLYRGLTFLVVSCPCALVVSIPLSFFGGIGGASRVGVLVKGGNYLEALADAETVVLDKTGTLTQGVFRVQSIVTKCGTEAELLEAAAYAEAYSTHPIARSIREAYAGEIDTTALSEVEELSGHGVRVLWNGKRIAAGNRLLMEREGLIADDPQLTGSIVHVAADGIYLGYLHIDDQIKADSAEALAKLRSCGVKRTVMLTGDRPATAAAIGTQLGIDEVHAELLPEGKVNALKELLGKKSKKGKLLYVGDGINDAPVLALADVGIAMGGLGSDAAIEAADVVIMNDSLAKLPTAISIARRTLSIARQNIVFALVIKVGVLVLSALGMATMWEAVFADVGVCVLAVMNAFRALKAK